jgi:hypothetical protein
MVVVVGSEVRINGYRVKSGDDNMDIIDCLKQKKGENWGIKKHEKHDVRRALRSIQHAA